MVRIKLQDRDWSGNSVGLKKKTTRLRNDHGKTAGLKIGREKIESVMSG